MADINFNCPFCSQNFDAPDDMAGEALDCPACNKTIKVPMSTPAPVIEPIIDPSLISPPLPQPPLPPPPAAPVIEPVVVPSPEPVPVPVAPRPKLGTRPVPSAAPMSFSSVPRPIVPAAPVQIEPKALELEPVVTVPEPVAESAPENIEQPVAVVAPVPGEKPVAPAVPVAGPRLGLMGGNKGAVGKPAFGKKPTLGAGLQGSAIAKKQAQFAASKMVAKPQVPVAPKQLGEYHSDTQTSQDAVNTPPVKAVMSKLAVGSLVAAFLGMSPVAVICGHMAVGRIKKSEGALKGKGLALVGLVFGYLQIITAILLIAALTFGVFKAKDMIVEGLKTEGVKISADSENVGKKPVKKASTEKETTAEPTAQDTGAVTTEPAVKAEETSAAVEEKTATVGNSTQPAQPAAEDKPAE